VGVTTVGFTLMGNQRIHKVADFKELVEEVGTWEELPEKTFAEAGMSANTCVVAMQKPGGRETADMPAEARVNEELPPPVLSHPDVETVAAELVTIASGENLQNSGAEAVTQPEPSPSLVYPSLLLAPENSLKALSALGTFSTFGLQVSGSEAQVTAFEGLWKGITGRKALFDLRKIPASKSKKAKSLPVAWQHAFLRGIYGGGYFHRTKFKHDARLLQPDGQPTASQSSETWEVNLREGPIEELVNMLKWRYSLVLLDDGAAYRGSLRHAVVEALRERLPDLVIGTLS
jgi:hypothetical protein